MRFSIQLKMRQRESRPSAFWAVDGSGDQMWLDKSLETIPSSLCVREPNSQRQYEFLFVLENAPQMFDVRLRVGGWGTKQTVIKVVCESI